MNTAISEDLLYYVWKHKLYGSSTLTTTEGETVEVLNPGIRNNDSGPDFSNARIKINGTKWAGNVEIHTRTSDWQRHNHQHDKNYSNLILHVVYEHDKELEEKVPTLVLKERLDERLLARYSFLKDSREWIPCERQIKGTDDFVFHQALDRMLVERLEKKTEDIVRRLEWNKNNWEETMYQLTARNFGLKINTDPFDLLARSLPLNIIGKHKNSLFQIEALLFGQAGMLEERALDDYQLSLQKEYLFLSKKYKLQPIEAKLWKFMRLRPPAFPTIRIAQFAMLLHKSKHLFSQVLACQNATELKGLFMTSTSTYWQEHYRFGTVAGKRNKMLGQKTIDLLIINTIAPLLFVYAHRQGQDAVREKAVQFLEQLPPEKNTITEKWRTVRYNARTAYHSQALLQLKNEHCDRKNCLNCVIGHKILSATTVD